MLRRLELAFWKTKKGIIAQNIEFKDLHRGETCLILGNGGSLKFFDFSALPPLPAIGCSYSLLDIRARKLSMKYCAITDSYLLYPFRKHSYENKIQNNHIGPILKTLVRRHPETTFFTSLTNYYGFLRHPANLRFFYHFGERASLSYDLAGVFGASQGALSIMLGMAKYLGFSKAIILGCDYLGQPKLEGHFYAHDRPFAGKDDLAYREQITKVARGIEVLCIFPKGVQSPDFAWNSFENEFNAPEFYQANHEIISPSDFLRLTKLAKQKQIWM